MYRFWEKTAIRLPRPEHASSLTTLQLYWGIGAWKKLSCQIERPSMLLWEIEICEKVFCKGGRPDHQTFTGAAPQIESLVLFSMVIMSKFLFYCSVYISCTVYKFWENSYSWIKTSYLYFDWIFDNWWNNEKFEEMKSLNSASEPYLP